MSNFKTKKRLFLLIAVLALSFVMIFGIVGAAACKKKKNNSDTFYYPNNGKGTTYNVSTAQEIVTLLNSSETLKAGDVVLVQPGEYKFATTNPIERITMLVSGAYNNYITIRNADPSKQCVFDFSAQEFDSTNRGVSIYGSYIYWYGIDVCGAGDNGMYIGGNYNTIENCEFYNNRDTGLQLGRSYSEYTAIDQWPSYNLVKNCTSHNNYDNDTYGENADGFAAKLTVGYGNVFDGCIAYRNSDDGWDLYAKTDSGNIGAVIIYNCVAYENGYLEYTQRENNARFPTWNGTASEDASNTLGKDSYLTRDGDGNGFKLGGSVMVGDVVMYNCLSFNNRMHGVTDNSNPGVLSVKGVTSYNNSAMVDDNPSSNNFGYILDVSNNDTHSNIDLSRQLYSYNNVSHVLSVKDSLALSLDADAYRGSVIDSLLLNKKIEGALDADTKNDDGQTGVSVKAPDSSDIFKVLPFTKNGDGSYTFNITGLKDLYKPGETDGELNPDRAHKKYRNSDGSINMGEILDIKDQSILFGQNNKIGSELNYATYEDYTHFFASDFVDLSQSSEEGAIVARAAETLTLNCDPEAVYQDFTIPSKMTTSTITWQSSNENYLKIVNDKDVSISKSEYIQAVVYRPLSDDVTVNLTATLTSGSATTNKVFTLNIKAGTPTIGTIFVTDAYGAQVADGGTLIVDQYAVYNEPEVAVENGLDYHGKLLSSDQYIVSTEYKFTDDKSKSSVTVAGFTPSNAGVYTITKTVALKSNTTQTKSMTYTIYVASPYADVDFMNEASISVNRYGYTISGDMTNSTGTIYAISSATPLNLTEANKSDLLTMQGVESFDFRGDVLSEQFENKNNGAYYIYYLVTNLNGDITSPLYTAEISVVEISNTTDFMTLAQGKSIGGESTAMTIYSLTCDLDYSDVTWAVGSTSFRGLLNGNGHTIKNLTVKGVGIFYKVDGGTIMNIKFDNVTITSEVAKTAIVSECTGGYFYNIQITNINVTTTNQRAAALIAHINVGTPVEIEQVSVNGGQIKAQQRAGGLVGFSQAGSSYTSGSIIVTITNCLVNANIVADFELGGIYGNYDCGNNSNCSYMLNISYCVFTGNLTAVGSKTFAGGILGYQKGAYSGMLITNCVSVGHIYFNNMEVETALKNCSGIVGSSSTLYDGITGRVRNCYARMEEYNTDYEVTAWDKYAVVSTNNYKNAGLDSEKWEFIADETSRDPANVVKAPYVNLLFLGEWE